MKKVIEGKGYYDVLNGYCPCGSSLTTISEPAFGIHEKVLECLNCHHIIKIISGLFGKDIYDLGERDND